MKRATATAFGAVILALVTGCGQSSDARSSAVTADDFPEHVIEDFGRAVYTGDTTTMIRLLEPTVASQLTDRDRSLLKGLSQTSGSVELQDFDFNVTTQSASAISVRYTGERCGPTTKTEFSGTSVEAGPGGNGTSASPGSTVKGDVTCVSLTDESATRDPFTFVRLDGKWYAKLPGLG